MNIETVIVTVSVVCFALSIYLAILSTEVSEAQLSMQFVSLALYFLIGGIAMLICWFLFLAIKKTLSKEG